METPVDVDIVCRGFGRPSQGGGPGRCRTEGTDDVRTGFTSRRVSRLPSCWGSLPYRQSLRYGIRGEGLKEPPWVSLTSGRRVSLSVEFFREQERKKEERTERGTREWKSYLREVGHRTESEMKVPLGLILPLEVGGTSIRSKRSKYGTRRQRK